MLFLDFWDGVWQNLGTLIERLLNILWLLICQIIYPLISLIFKIFTDIAGSLTDGGFSVEINEIINRITLILTIVMTFYIVFEFVKYTVTPDSITDKEKGAMPLFARIIIAILLLAFVPRIFRFASDLQDKVLKTNVIGTVILGPSQSNQDIEGLGREFSGSVFGSFLRVKCYDNETKNSGDCKAAHDEVDKLVQKTKKSAFILDDAFSLTFSNTRIRFAGLLAVGVGAFILYVVFLYCKDIALREIQFMFLQIMSPIAIISYIAPKKDNMFQKWMKQTLTTYLDIFIRLAALYFMLLMINLLSTKLLNSTNEDRIIEFVFLVIGLMMFLKKIPKMLQELFPSSGAASIGLGFSGKDREGLFGLGSFRKTAAYAAGAIAGGSRAFKGRKSLYTANDKGKGFGKWARRTGITSNAMARSAWEGIKAGKDGKTKDAIRAGREKVQQYESIVARGGTVLGHDFLPNYYQNKAADLKLKISTAEEKIKQKETNAGLSKRIKTAQDAAEDRAKKKIESQEQKIVVSDISKIKMDATSMAKVTGMGFKFANNSTTSQIYSQFVAAAKMQSDTVVAKTQALEAAKTNLSLAKAEGNATKIVAASADIARLQGELQDAAQSSAELEAIKGEALKKLSRFAITKSMDPTLAADERDPALTDLVNSAQSTLADIQNAFAEQIKALEDAGKTESEIIDELNITKAMFDRIKKSNGFKVSEFKELDDIQGEFSSYATTLADKIATAKEQIRIDQANAENIMATVNSEGKK